MLFEAPSIECLLCGRRERLVRVDESDLCIRSRLGVSLRWCHRLRIDPSCDSERGGRPEAQNSFQPVTAQAAKRNYMQAITSFRYTYEPS